MPACIDHQDRKLNKSRDYGRNSGTVSAESRKSEMSVDQDPVADEID